MKQLSSKGALKTRCSTIHFSIRSHGQRDGRSDKLTDRPSSRDAFLMNASKNMKEVTRKKKKKNKRENSFAPLNLIQN